MRGNKHIKNPPPKRRLHAYIVDGIIDMHLDTEKDGQHKAGKFGSAVHSCIEEFYKIDGVEMPKKASPEELAVPAKSLTAQKLEPTSFLIRLFREACGI